MYDALTRNVSLRRTSAASGWPFNLLTRKFVLLRYFLVCQDIAGILGAGWIDRHVTFVDVLDDPVFVDHKGGAVSIATLFVKEPVVFHDCSFEIAEQREGYAVLFGEFSVGENAVDAETKNLSIIRFEFGDISLIRLHLLCSTTGESQYIEGQHHVFLSLKVTQLESQGPAVRP